MVLVAAAVSPTPAAAATCAASSGAAPPIVVELYTSEGCSSCPPADRWLSSLKGRPGVLPIAFHVDYWDRLGWRDRFASREATQRQYELAHAAGASNVYTPQVVAGGRDWRSWPRLPAAPADAGIAVTLRRDGSQVRAEVAASGARRLAAVSGYWVVLEDGHASRVTAGENSGATLRHDHVVRLYQPLPRWTPTEARSFALEVLPGVPAHPRRVALVVTDAATLAPLQAVALAC